MDSSKPDNYHVATKAFVTDKDKVLICKDRKSQTWDLPGGRVGVGEFNVAFDKILEREIREELGEEIQYKNNGPVAIFRHRREEYSNPLKPVINVLMIGFELVYISGELILSDEHDEFRWVSAEEAHKLLPGGQQDGMGKYIEYMEKGKLIY